MADAKYDVLGIGNAIFDVLVQTDENFLGRHGMTKGGMALIDETRAAAIYRDMGPATKMSGGSAANTIVGRRELRRPRRLCRQGQGRRGRPALHPDIRAAQRRVRHQGRRGWPGHRLLLHPGDAGRRAHHEHLSRRGAGIDACRYRAAQIAAASIVYLEGYLWDPKSAKDAFVKAATIAHGAGRQVALTLSDAFCVDRYRDEFSN